MKRTWVYDKEGRSREITPTHVAEVHFVQADIAEFRSTDGVQISGRRQWREHLKRTGNVEMGHADIANAQQQWAKKKEKFSQRLKRDTRGHGGVAPSDAPVLQARDYEMSRINKEVANRLHGRPAPSRVQLIKMALEEARRERQ